MTAPTSPRTPTARKTLPGSPSATTPNIIASGSPLQKIQWKGGNTSLPQQFLTRPEGAGGSANLAQTMPTMRQRLGEGTNDQRNQYLSPAASPLRAQHLTQVLPSLHLRPLQLQPGEQRHPLATFQMIFLRALQNEPNLTPPTPTQIPVDSTRIDRITHAMWQVVFQHDIMMKDVTTKASMLPQMKLRALAKLNYLPSWWILREVACSLMLRQSWLVNDGEMETLWRDTIDWCKRVEAKVGMQGDKVPAPKREASETSPAQEQTVKVET
ncbi:hypothetical protein OPT61_g476 [Boeremia exigua]|uniref:Uncharacterized protein n=1 Tax=Boeremia exigua TaxID=749465 RepID=A0ACC2IU36_9PLEO|nr:hypothetical protein OPT61_g476 [Boeremia exigua]